MSRKKLILNEEIIRKTFGDEIKLKREISEKESCQDESPTLSGDLFESEDEKLVKITYQLRDFTPKELTNVTEYAEDIYERYEKHVTIYIICHKDINVCVKECPIFSKASFSIKLIMEDSDPAFPAFEEILKKFDEGKILDTDDLYNLSKLPALCKKENRRFFREEYFRIMNEVL